MYNLRRNNYHLRPKNSTVYTPSLVSEFLFCLLSSLIKSGLILDPCSGGGSLLKPWKENGYQVLGVDCDAQSTADIQTDFLALTQWEQPRPSLVLCNPPFNGYGNKLASEVWLAKIIALFGSTIPLALFTPVGLRNNCTLQSRRYQKFLQGEYPTISSLLALPKNIFPHVVFHSEIIFFNVEGLQPHYFLPPPEDLRFGD